MDELYYQMIFKRKSFHTFKGIERISKDEIEAIQSKIKQLIPLTEGIRIEFKIVPKEETTCKRGEYCILIYSEKKEYHLQNIGYMGEQLDLWLAAQNIGVCWFGMGKPKEMKYEGLDFVIMLAIGKEAEGNFRKDYTKAKRKEVEEIWNGVEYPEISSVVRYAPSACNSQPWLVEGKKEQICLYQVKGKRGIMPREKVEYYNQIDIGIFMLFMEIAMTHVNIKYQKKLEGEQPVAIYTIEFATLI